MNSVIFQETAKLKKPVPAEKVIEYIKKNLDNSSVQGGACTKKNLEKTCNKTVEISKIKNVVVRNLDKRVI